ncbi:MAG: succinate--CoA ligase subunit alpha [Candidatus Altiarchaeota archaeon]
MAVLIDENTRIVVQGATGKQGSFHMASMIDYGAKVVAGVTPGKGGGEVDGIPVFNSISEIEDKVDASIIFVPARFAMNAASEAISHELNPVVVITEHIPVYDSMKFVAQAEEKNISVVGPNTPGLISPGKSKMGIMPNHIFSKGNIGVVSRSGTLTYEIVASLTKGGYGQSTAIGLGGDPVVGLSFIDILEMFEKDKQTKAIVMLGEIGGSAEEEAAAFIKESKYKKPVVAYVAGKTAPKGKRMGHAGAVISGSSGTYEAKKQALEKADVKVADLPKDVVSLLKEVL